MLEIKEIYKVVYMRGEFNYVGLLRNEKKFNLSDNVFFNYEGNKIARGVVVGVELPPVDNPEYRYKIKVPEELITGEDDVYDKIICDGIFLSIEEAKESAHKNLDRMIELQHQEIERYFKQFENKSEK